MDLADSAAVISVGAAQTVTGDSGNLEQKLSGIADRLSAAFGEQLVSAILYGSAAMNDWNEQGSDLNVLCVLRQLTPHELRQSEPVFRWWREQGNSPPLLMSVEEVRGSTDCFPMEFHDMQAHRRVLVGQDVIEDLAIDQRYYRAQVEHELRAKQIRLRQKATEVLSKPAQLLRLMSDSLSTFSVLGRHALILSGRPAQWKKRDILASLEDVLRRSLSGSNAILALRESGKFDGQSEAVPLLEKYLAEMDALVRFVDALEH